MNIYLVMGSSSDYEWQESWVASCHKDETKAKEFCDKLNVIANQHKALSPYGGTGAKRAELFVELQNSDPSAVDCGFGIQYQVEIQELKD